MEKLEFKKHGLVKISPLLSYDYKYLGKDGRTYIGNPEVIIELTNFSSLMIPIDIDHRSKYEDDWDVVGFIKSNSLKVLSDGIYGEMYLTTDDIDGDFTGLSPVYVGDKKEDGTTLVKRIESVTFTADENFCELSFDTDTTKKNMCYTSSVIKN